MKELRKRWSPERATSTAEALAAGDFIESPFPPTAHNLIDLRGLVIDKPLILKVKGGAPVDLAGATFQKLLFMQCTLDDWSFEDATISLLCNGSKVSRTSFKGVKFKTLSCGGGTRFETCDFSNADFSGTSVNEAHFDRCVFDGSKISNVELGTSSFDNATFSGVFKKVFLRGIFRQCDFRQASFIDCAFYGARFTECHFSENTLLFANWTASLARIMNRLPSEALSPGARKSIESMCKVWNKLDVSMPNNIVDLTDLTNVDGVEIGQELFRFFKSIATE